MAAKTKAPAVRQTPSVRVGAIPRAGPGAANPLHKVAVFTAFTFVFLAVSRIMDLLAARLHMPLILAAVSLAAVAASGRWVNFFKTRTGPLYLAMTVWMVLGVPFAIWRTGALDVIRRDWLDTVIMVGIVMSVTVTYKETTYLMNTIAFGVLVAALVALSQGETGEGQRLIILRSGTLNNPNMLAFVMLLGPPLWWRFMVSGRGVVRKCIGVAALPPIFLCFFKTGSRGGLLMLGVMATVAFLRASLWGKLQLLLAALLIGSFAFATLPSSLRERFFTIEAPETEDPEDPFAQAGTIQSTRQRLQNLKDSIMMTLHHPIFGVGPGNFAFSQDKDYKAAGLRKGSWLGTHNTYTQFSSECGIPGLIFFVSLLVIGIRALNATRRRTRGDFSPLAGRVRNTMLAAEVLIWGTAAFAMVAHMGYSFEIHLLLCLPVVATRAANRELQAAPLAAGGR